MKCFIIMPITTPAEWAHHYGNDPDHFSNVIEYLFIPAIKAANMEPIPPSSEASQIIHSDIISKLASSEMVLCDISSLNSNVFFELGVRTALNKPVCLVKDDVTTNIPFDTIPIQYETYRSALTVMHHENDLKRISDHLIRTQDKNSNYNAMWKAFGISQTASPPEPSSIEEKLDFLIQRSDPNFALSLTWLREFSPKVATVLINADLYSLREVANISEEMFKKVNGIGNIEISEIKQVLANHGLSLKCHKAMRVMS